MIKTSFSVQIQEEPKQPASPPRTKAASPKNKFSPKRENLPKIEPPTQPVAVAAPPMIKQQSPRVSVKQPTAIARPSGGISNLYSPTKNVKKKVDTGLRPRNAGPEELVALLQNTPSPRAGRYAQRRTDKQARASDIFGDFFGFGPNPPGCLSKGAPQVDLKAEKAKFLDLLSSEAKRYDIQGMHFDLNTKMEQIVKAIKKEEKIIMNDEERQLRNLDKLEYMSQYLNEDHIMTQNSL
mgnify:CR=1 FL=1